MMRLTTKGRLRKFVKGLRKFVKGLIKSTNIQGVEISETMIYCYRTHILNSRVYINHEGRKFFNSKKSLLNYLTKKHCF